MRLIMKRVLLPVTSVLFLALSALPVSAATKSCQVDILHASGLTVSDMEKAGLYYKNASEHGDDQYAMEYKFTLAAALLGSPDAMLWMGEMYQGGHVPGVSKENAVEEAFKWWEKAYKAGQPRGYTNMGLMYLHTDIPGGGNNFATIPVDFDKAVAYLEKATAKNDMKAPRALGLLYFNGKGKFQKDEVKALSYFKIAMDRGDSTGTVYYADALLSGKLVPQDVNKAMSLYQSIIDSKGHDAGLCGYKMGKIYEDGKYVSKNLDKAKGYYKVGAEHHNSDAEQALSKL